MNEFLLGLLLILTIGWLVFRIRQNKASVIAESRPDVRETGIYQAVAIKYSENACNAAKAMTGRRFLASAAPKLPLPECDFPDCRCKFAHHNDRRTGRDRRSPFAPAGSSGATGSFTTERRQRKERRDSSDQ